MKRTLALAVCLFGCVSSPESQSAGSEGPRNSDVDAVFGDLLTFTLVFAILYVPIAVLIGRWHMRNQYKVESTMTFMNNPSMLRAFRLLFDLETNSANKDDVEAFKKLLKRLETETTFSELSGKSEKE